MSESSQQCISSNKIDNPIDEGIVDKNISSNQTYETGFDNRLVGTSFADDNFVGTSFADDNFVGTCEGSESMYIKIITSDDHEYIIKREYALLSKTIEAMLSGPGMCDDNETNIIHFREIPSHVLDKLCLYFTYKSKYTNSSNDIPEFTIEPEIALELLMAANFLDC